MALVKCPECGRENVSDSAVCCPNCGFGIKGYYDDLAKKKAQQEQAKAEEQHRIETVGERQKAAISRLEKQIENSKKEIRNSIIGLIVAVPIAISSWIFSEDGSLIIFSMIAICICLAYLSSGIKDKNTAIKDLETAKQDFLEYEKVSEQRTNATLAQVQAYQVKNAAKHPKCPMCGSTNTERISTLSRTASVAAVGLASSKIGKQYVCKRCKHKW